jgi:hypothetical protein
MMIGSVPVVTIVVVSLVAKVAKHVDDNDCFVDECDGVADATTNAYDIIAGCNMRNVAR